MRKGPRKTGAIRVRTVLGILMYLNIDNRMC